MIKIHTFPTSNPSRLHYFTANKAGFYLYPNNELVVPRNPNCINQYIYITNDEDIKKGSIVLSTYDKWEGTSELKPVIGKVIETHEHGYLIQYYSEYFGETQSMWDKGYSKSIIMANNPELINEGVQAIPEEFLEWFVKHPTNEKIEIIYGLFNPMGRQVDPNNWVLNHSQCVWKYKIITPKDEVFEMYKDLYGKPVKMNDRFETEHIWNEELALKNKGKYIPKEEHKEYKTIIVGSSLPKEETLEEVAERLTNDFPHYSVRENMSNTEIKECFLEALQKGVKWQQERSYSDEEVLKILDTILSEYRDSLNNKIDFHPALRFEQFKKK